MKVVVRFNSEQETMDFASKLALVLKKGTVITLKGNLGAGKTVFAKGIGKGLGIKQEITSPTFNILKCYFDGKLPFYHIDAYRLEDSKNKDIGLEEVIDGDGVCLIEWPMFIEEFIDKHIDVEIEIVDACKRNFIFDFNDNTYDNVLSFIREYTKCKNC